MAFHQKVIGSLVAAWVFQRILILFLSRILQITGFSLGFQEKFTEKYIYVVSPW